MTFVQLAKRFVPPIVGDTAKVLFGGDPAAAPARIAADPQRDAVSGLPEFEYVQEGWRYRNPRVRGLDVETILELEKAKWPLIERLLHGPGPLGIAHEAPTPSNTDLEAHNVVMSFAYVLALAAHKRDRMSLLDWGGSIGHYYLLSKALLANVTLDYYCKEFPRFCEYGRELLPDAHFYDNEAYTKQQYDLVLMSGVLQCVEDWRGALKQVAAVTRGYLYVTRIPVVNEATSFVAVQRPYYYGYETEYLFWFFNRAEFLGAMRDLQMELVREFVIHPALHVVNAPEQGDFRGFLFRAAVATLGGTSG